MAGIYIHIPFCKQRCTYCDFHFSTSFTGYKDKMINSLGAELALRTEYLENDTINTVYFGGGTPSLLDFEEFQVLFNAIKAHFTLSPEAEFCLEANPDDINADSLLAWKKLGFNRLSIGLQSFRESDLKWMNRAHNSKEALACVPLAKSHGFDAISIDLIYGLPNLDLETWREQIKIAVGLGVEHISAYCLTVEEKTVLAKKVESGAIIPSNENEQSDQFNLLVEELSLSGFERYEISNFCRDKKYSKHNTAYWKGTPYLGIGPSAHSFDGNNRAFNIANNSKYIKEITSGNLPLTHDILAPKDRFNELLMTGLRTKWGVSIEQLKAHLPLGPEFLQKTDEFIEKGWVIRNDEHLFLQGEGWLMADYIAAELFSE
jgi:oxygen-independent coproporphyrinogen-3 oxidase